jgi:hypothetical protein
MVRPRTKSSDVCPAPDRRGLGRSYKLASVKATVISVDIVRGGMIINFGDGTAALFDAQFLYAHRNEGNNTLLPDSESSSTKIGRP